MAGKEAQGPARLPSPDGLSRALMESYVEGGGLPPRLPAIAAMTGKRRQAAALHIRGMVRAFATLGSLARTAGLRSLSAEFDDQGVLSFAEVVAQEE